MAQQLTYYIPKHGPEKVLLTIPESHSLHICPPACGRRNGIRAIRNGEKPHISFLYITQAELISGHYADLVGDAVEELLSVLQPVPKVFQLYVNCVDDFLGTDEKALVSALCERFPACRFAVLHIHPVASDEKIKPGMEMHSKLFDFLEPSPKDTGINFIGNFVPLDGECELFDVFRQWKVGPVRQIFDCESFAAYSLMAQSCANIVLQEMGTYAAENLQRRLGTPWEFFPASYRVEAVEGYYARLARLLDKPMPPLDGFKKRVEEEIVRTRQALGSRKLIVDSGATMCPGDMTRALLEYGFAVDALFLLHPKDADAPVREWISTHHPQVHIIRREAYADIRGYGLAEDAVCIGFDSAYLLQAKHYVDMRHDEGFFGFRGIIMLMEKIRACLDREERWA